MNKVSVKRWYSSPTGETLQIKSLQEMKNKPGVVSMKVFHIKHRVKWPIIFFDKKHISNAATSPSYTPGPRTALL